MRSFNSFSFSPDTPIGYTRNEPCCLYRMRVNKHIPKFVFPLEFEMEVLLPPMKVRVVGITDIVSPVSSMVRIRMFDIEYVKEL